MNDLTQRVARLELLTDVLSDAFNTLSDRATLQSKQIENLNGAVSVGIGVSVRGALPAVLHRYMIEVERREREAAREKPRQRRRAKNMPEEAQ